MSDKLIERRAIQRDWLGHVLQLLGILVLLGIPLIIWGISINTSVATLTEKIERNEKDIVQQHQVQTLVTQQVLDVNKQLIKIDTLLGEIRRDFQPRR